MAVSTNWNGYEVGRNSLFIVDPRALKVDWSKNLSRGGEEIQVDDSLKELALDMVPQGESSSGQINPITVRSTGKDTYEVVLGYRRFRAALWLIESQTCPDFRIRCVTSSMNDVEAALKNMSENLQREDPKPIQTASAIRRLKEDYGYTYEDIAKRLKRSLSWVMGRLELLNLNEDNRKSLEQGDLSLSAASELAKLNEEAQRDAAAEISPNGEVITPEAVRENRRQKGDQIKRGFKELKTFIKMKSEQGEVANNLAVVLLNYLDGSMSEEEASQTWDRFGLDCVNYIQDLEETEEAAA